MARSGARGRVLFEVAASRAEWGASAVSGVFAPSAGLKFRHEKWVSTVPTGKVKWYDGEKGFGFLSQDGGEDVYVRAEALPDGVESLKAGQKVEFGMVTGRRGPQALSVQVLDPAPTVKRGGRRAENVNRRPADELHGMVEDMITLLESKVQPDLRRGKYPDRKTAQMISEVVRAVARELDS